MFTIAEFIEKLKQYPQDIHIGFEYNEYWFKIEGYSKRLDRFFYLFSDSRYDDEINRLSWADPITLELKPKSFDDDENL